MGLERTPEQRATLTRISMLTGTIDGHKQLGEVLSGHRAQLIREAADQGVPVAEIARKSNLSRPMIYKIIDNGESE